MAGLLPKLHDGITGFRSPQAVLKNHGAAFRTCTAIIYIYIYIYLEVFLCLLQDYDTASLRPMLTELCADADLWAEADMAPVVRYLRGAKGLNMPRLLRELIDRPPMSLDAD